MQAFYFVFSHCGLELWKFLCAGPKQALNLIFRVRVFLAITIILRYTIGTQKRKRYIQQDENRRKWDKARVNMIKYHKNIKRLVSVLLFTVAISFGKRKILFSHVKPPPLGTVGEVSHRVLYNMNYIKRTAFQTIQWLQHQHQKSGHILLASCKVWQRNFMLLSISFDRTLCIRSFLVLSPCVHVCISPHRLQTKPHWLCSLPFVISILYSFCMTGFSV